MTRCPTCGCFHAPDEPHKVYDGPMYDRWVPGSLAEAVSDLRSEAVCVQADAVERLTKATRRVVEARNNLRAFRGPETKEKWDELWMAIDEAAGAAYLAEEWSDQ